VDYEAILRQAETEADVIVWDGGNNDLPFYRPSLEIVVVDPHRPGHELTYWPGEVNFRRAQVLVINKMSTAEPSGIEIVRANIRAVNPGATVIEADSPLIVEEKDAFRGKRVLAVEDGPTLTHGDMTYGAAVIAAREGDAKEIVDPRSYAVGTIAEAFRSYPKIGALLPAIGYGAQQIADLAETIRRVPCDVVAIGTPIDLRRLISFDKPAVRVLYELAERGKPDLASVLEKISGRRAGDGDPTMPLNAKDLISLHDLTSDEMEEILDLAGTLKGNPAHYASALQGQTLAMIFEKPSLRTRVTFEAGMTQLGGHSIYLGPSDAQMGKRESVPDVARNLERWVDGIMARTFAHQTVVDLARYASIPVINGLSDYSHPVQGLADYMTLKEVKGDLPGKTLAYVGDGNNVATRSSSAAPSWRERPDRDAGRLRPRPRGGPQGARGRRKARRDDRDPHGSARCGQGR
jgi:hypothetical protein